VKRLGTVFQQSLESPTAPKLRSLDDFPTLVDLSPGDDINRFRGSRLCDLCSSGGLATMEASSSMYWDNMEFPIVKRILALSTQHYSQCFYTETLFYTYTITRLTPNLYNQTGTSQNPS